MNVYVVVGEYGTVLRVFDTASRAEAFVDGIWKPATVQKWPVES